MRAQQGGLTQKSIRYEIKHESINDYEDYRSEMMQSKIS